MKSIEISCDTCPNKDCSLLRFSDIEWLTFFNAAKKTTFYRKGQQVVYERTPAQGIYFVLSGKLKVFKTGNNGRHQILRLLKEADIFGHRSLDRHHYPASVSTIEDSELCFIRKEDFLKAIMANPDLTYNMMLFYTSELNHAEKEVKNLAQLSVREKVANVLLKIEECYSMNGNRSFLGTTLSRQEMADLAGTTKEQVSKNLSDFRNEKVIHLDGRQIEILDKESLTQIAGVLPDSSIKV